MRTGCAPRVMAGMRNLVLGVPHKAGAANIAAVLREVGWTQNTALQLLGLFVA